MLRHERHDSSGRCECAFNGEPKLQGAHGQRDRVDLSRVTGGVRRFRRHRTHYRPSSGARRTMMITLEGRARQFGDDINTDYIISSTRKRDTIDANVLKQWLLEHVDPTFAASVKPGDIIVAGKNFGCGSAMEVAATVIMAAGIKAVVAQSFSRTFFRNAINNGLMPVQCDTSGFEEGDRISVKLDGSTITVVNFTKERSLTAEPIPEVMLRILQAGGLVPHMQLHRAIAGSGSTITS